MSILVGCPVIKNAVIWRECLNQLLYKEGVHVLVILNGADQDVLDMMKNEYPNHPDITIIKNPVNVFVTAAWNQIIKFFLNNGRWDHAVILNSDLTLQEGWDKACESVWHYEPNCVLLPTVTDDKNKCYEPVQDPLHKKLHTEGEFAIPGIFITLNRAQCELVFPIDERIRVWFNDSWVFALLAAAKYPIVTLKNLYAYHHHSVSVGSVSGVLDVIEADKIAWDTVVRPELENRIKTLKSCGS